MRRLISLICIVASISIATVAARAQTVAVGAMFASGVFGGNSPSDVSANVLYTANQETLKQLDPLSIRQAASVITCVGSGSKTLAQIYSDTVGRRETHLTLLQVVRVFTPHNTACATYWFTFIEKK